MGEASDIISDLVRERDYFKAYAEAAQKEIQNRDTIVTALIMELAPKRKKFVLSNLKGASRKHYEARGSEDGKQITLTIRNKTKAELGAEEEAEDGEA